MPCDCDTAPVWYLAKVLCTTRIDAVLSQRSREVVHSKHGSGTVPCALRIGAGCACRARCTCSTHLATRPATRPGIGADPRILERIRRNVAHKLLGGEREQPLETQIVALESDLFQVEVGDLVGYQGGVSIEQLQELASVRSFLDSSSSLRDMVCVAPWAVAAAAPAAADDEVDGISSSLSCGAAEDAVVCVGVAAPDRVPSRPRRETYLDRSSCVATPSTKALPGSVMNANGCDCKNTSSSASPVSGVMTVYVAAGADEEADAAGPLENLVMMEATVLSLLPSLSCSSRRCFWT